MRVVKILGIVVATIVLLVIAVVAGGLWWVQSHDMSSVATWAVKKQGYDVAFNGPVRVKLWPSGDVSLGKVVVLGGDQKPMFSTESAELSWKWGGGLTPWNGLQVTHVAAANPVVTLIRGKDGVANWDAYVGKQDSATAKPKANATASGGGLPLGMLAATQLDIVNLNATYSDGVSGQKVVAQAVNLTAEMNGTEAVTTLNAIVNAQKVSGNLTVDVAKLDDIPLVVKLAGAGLTVAMDGRVHEQKSFAGMVNVQTANLKQTLAGLMGKAPDQAPAAAFQLGGDVDVGTTKVSLKNFSTHLGDLLQASGNAVVNLGDKPSASGTVRVQGSNLRQLAELALMAPQPSLPASPFIVTTDLTGQDAIELKNLNASIGTLLTAAGSVKVVPQSGKQPDVDASLNVTIPNAQALAKAAGQAAKVPAKAVTAQAGVKGRNGTYDISGLSIQMDDVATLKGDMKVIMGTQPEVDGKVEINGTNLKTAAAGFGVDASALPANAFKVKASVSGKGTLTADDLLIDMPQLLEATGKVKVTLGSPLNVVANLDVTKMNLTALGYCAVNVPTQTGAPTAEAPASNANAAPWSDDKINVSALQQVAFDLTLTAKGIDCARLPMDSLSAKVSNTPSQLDITNVSVNVTDGGSAKLTGRLEHSGTPALVLNATTSKLKIEKLVPVLATKGVELPLDTDAQLTSRGATSRQLVQSLDGTVKLAATQGKLPYTNLLGSASSLAGMIQGSSSTTPSNGSGTVDSMKAQYTIRQGVATTDVLTVATGNGAMTLNGSGTIDLPNWVLDYTLTPSLAAGSGALAIPVVMKGPLTAPKIGADPAFLSKISGKLAGQALKGVLGKDAAKSLGNVLGGVLGGGSTTSGTAAGGKPTLNNLLKAFGK